MCPHAPWIDTLTCKMWKKIEVRNHKKYEHGTQVSRYNILKGISE